MMNRQHLAAIVSVSFFILLLSLALPISAQELTRIEPSICPIDVPSEPQVECGTLIVPKNYERPDDGAIRLPFIIIHSSNPTPAPDPILFTEGGPGYSSLDSVWWLARSDFVQERDIVILEQRGNRYAQPSLTCDISVWWQETADHTPCLDNLKNAGLDLANYTTAASVQDINSLRQALDYEAWNLFGSSYSTRLMLLTMQQYPAGIRSVLLTGVSSLTETRYEHDPEHTARALDVLFTDCAANPACAAAYPDLAARFYNLVSQLNADPILVAVNKARDGTAIEPTTVEVNGYTLIEWMVVDSFYEPTNLQHPTSYMPLLIDQIEKGNFDLLLPWVLNHPKDIFAGSNFAWGLYFAINCQDDASIAAAVDTATTYPELEGYLRHGREMEICAAWQLSSADPLLDRPVSSDIPTLILAGSYDPITPPEWGQSAAQNLSNGRFYEFAAWGHNVLTENPCAINMARDFFADPTQVLDTGCIETLPPAAFVLPQDVVVNPTIYRIHYGDGGDTQTEEIVGFVALIILMVAFIILLIAGIVWLLYKHSHNPPLNRHILYTSLIMMAVALAFGGFAFGMDAGLTATAATTPLLIRFGMPADYQALLLLPKIGAVLTIVLLIMTIRLWLHRDGSLLLHIFFSITALTAIMATIIYTRWELIF